MLAQRAAALELIMTIKEKQDASIKERFCTDYGKQQGPIAGEDAASPTITLDSVFLEMRTF